MTTRRARLMIGCSWLICLLIGFSPAMGWSYPGDGSKCWYITVATREHILFTVSIGIFLPLGIIVVLYAFILYKAIRHVDNRKSSTKYNNPENIHMLKPNSQSTSEFSLSRSQGSRRQMLTTHDPNYINTSQKKWKAIKVVLFTLSAFIVSWFPYFIAVVIYVVKPNGKLAVTIATVLAVLGFLNSLLNPLIYAWWHRGLRKFIVEDCLCRKRKSYRLGTTRSKSSTSSTSISKGSSCNTKSSVV
ncbi:alpha-1A adrenergic receptor-like [Limulus polyphemus]|uniref:Alpha-1A adrenergic receptor-like n=1 Tax=Limulus polyphemus TaxID=6850 RepID=A0ABM1BPF1_LIMPO|nr:alpha-1A adrenergic receptor-like [Limulus polyphemus]